MDVKWTVNSRFTIYVLIFGFFFVGPDQIPLREEFEQITLKAMLNRFSGDNGPDVITSTQLSWLACLAASVSRDSVQILVTHNSLGEGISESLHSACQGSHHQRLPDYVMIICSSRIRGNEFCVLVLGQLCLSTACHGFGEY